MSSQQRPGLIAQFFESFFGISWVTVDEAADEEALAPLCAACRNPTRRAQSATGWACPYHPRASLIERGQAVSSDER